MYDIYRRTVKPLQYARIRVPLKPLTFANGDRE